MVYDFSSESKLNQYLYGVTLVGMFFFYLVYAIITGGYVKDASDAVHECGPHILIGMNVAWVVHIITAVTSFSSFSVCECTELDYGDAKEQLKLKIRVLDFLFLINLPGFIWACVSLATDSSCAEIFSSQYPKLWLTVKMNVYSFVGMAVVNRSVREYYRYIQRKYVDSETQLTAVLPAPIHYQCEVQVQVQG